eukprot:4105098-Pyramimonas_sp.AAC.1
MPGNWVGPAPSNAGAPTAPPEWAQGDARAAAKQPVEDWFRTVTNAAQSALSGENSVAGAEKTLSPSAQPRGSQPHR